MEALAEIKKRLEVIENRLNSPMPINHECYTAEEVAGMVGCSKGKINKDEKDGILISRYPNSKRKFHKQDVERYLRGIGGKNKKGVKK